MVTKITQEEIKARIGQLAADLILREAQSQRFGVILRDIEPINCETFIRNSLKRRKSDKLTLRIAIPDPDLGTIIPKMQEEFSDSSNLLANTEEEIVAWRNEHLRTIAVLTNKPLARGASLRDFETRDDQDAIKLLAHQKAEDAQTAFLRNFWKAIAHDRAPEDFRLEDIVRFALALESLPNDDARGLQLKDHLPILGLLKDSGIDAKMTPADVAKRLNDNQRLLEDARSADPNERKRMQSYVGSLNGDDKKVAKQIQKSLKKLAEHPSDRSILSELEFSDSQKVWLGRKTVPDKGGNDAKISFQPVQNLSVKAVLAKDKHLLDDLYESIKQAVERVEHGDVDGKTVDLSQDAYGSHATLQISQDLLRLVRAGTGEEVWGMLVNLSDLSETTILDVDEWGHRKYLHFDDAEGAGGLIRTFVEAQALPQIFLSLVEQLKQHRNILIGYLAGLTASPLTTLAAKTEARQAAEMYLQSYTALLEAIANNAQDATNASPEIAQNLFASLVVLETYIFKTEEEVAVVLSPIHPLHLWRWVVAAKELLDGNEKFNPTELEAIEETLSNNLHYLNSLHLPEEITHVPAVDLGLAGQIGSLPLYKKNPRSLGVDDGAISIGKLASSLAQMRPFVRPGLRVMLINPPRPENFVRELIKQVQPDSNGSNNLISGIHIRIRYTDDDARDWVDGLDDIDEDIREAINMGQRVGRISLDISSEKLNQKEIEKELQEMPAHLTIIFDPFEVRQGRFRREGALVLNPWVLSYRYEYDKIKKQVNQVPVADSNVFGSYLMLVGTLQPSLRKLTITHAPNAEDKIEHLATLSNHSTWLVVADRHGVPISTSRIDNAYCVDTRQDKGRVLTTLSHDLEPFKQALARELKSTYFDADPPTLTSIVQDLVALEPEGILGIGSASKDGDKTTKAALGKIVVVRSYRHDHPSGLAVSLDTPEARQWLVAGRESRKQADLIGLREAEDGNLILDIIEVKTHDAGTLFTIDQNGCIQGDPVNQVMATYRAVASIFGNAEADSPLVRPRREVLRNHLYQACLRDTDPQFKERWHSLLNDLFDRKVPLKIQAQIVRVRLASVAPQERTVLQTPEGIPILFRTLNAEAVGLTLRGLPRKAATPKQVELDLQTLSQANHPIPSELDPISAFNRLQSSTGTEATSSNEPITPIASTEAISSREVTPVSNDVPKSITSEPETTGSNTATTAQQSTGYLSILLGNARKDSQPRYWEPAKQPNGFFMILGASGSGKTETLKVVAEEIHRFGIPCLIFDFHGDVTLQEADDYILSHAPACTHGINPMELDSTDPADGGVYAQVNILLGMLKACIPSLGHRQWRVIKDILNQVYESAGISDRNPASWERTPPTFADVRNLLEEQIDSDDIPRAQKNIIESAHDAVSKVFEHPIFAKAQQISIETLLDRSHHLNLVHLEEDIRFVVTDTLLRKLARALKSRGNIPVQPQSDREQFRLFVFVDEAKILSMGGKDRDATDAVLNKLATEYRKFGLGMVLASQMSDHFSNETKGQMATRLVLKPFDYNEAKKNAQDVNLTADDLMELTGRGDGYLRIGTNANPTRIQIKPLLQRNL
jgi:Helicase HerA, central domain